MIIALIAAKRTGISVYTGARLILDETGYKMDLERIDGTLRKSRVYKRSIRHDVRI